MNNIKVDIIKEGFRRDKHGHNYCIAKCPYCCNFFVARRDSIDNGKTKSCGCLKRDNAKRMGLSNKKGNVYYFPQGCMYGLCFFNNIDDYFIFDVDKYDLISQYTWFARKHKKRIDPVAVINGKKTYISRFLMNTPDDLECDHINHNTKDVRMCNLRNCTKQENRYNRKDGNGEVYEKEGMFYIKKLAGVDTNEIRFETEKDAYGCMLVLQNMVQGEYSYRKSQEIAEKTESNEFVEPFFYYGVLEKIYRLPQKNIFKRILCNIQRDYVNGKNTEEVSVKRILELIKFYKNYRNTA